GQLVSRPEAGELQRAGAGNPEVEAVDLAVVVQAVGDRLAIRAEGHEVSALELHRRVGERLARDDRAAEYDPRRARVRDSEVPTGRVVPDVVAAAGARMPCRRNALDGARPVAGTGRGGRRRAGRRCVGGRGGGRGGGSGEAHRWRQRTRQAADREGAAGAGESNLQWSPCT